MAILNDLVVKGPAKFLGSVDANLNVVSAEKLTTSAGGGANPIYFSGGKPVACTYSLNKSVPSNAVFTDNNVTNTLATTTKAYITGTTSSTTNTGTQVFDTGVYLDTTAGMLTATTFKGNLSGTASNADTVDGLHASDFAKSVSPSITGSMVFQNDSNQNTINAIYSANDNLVLRNISKDGLSVCDLIIGNDGVRIANATQNFIVGNGGNADTLDGLHASDFMPINGEVRKYGLIRMNGSDGIRVRHIDGNDTEADGALYLNWNSPNAPIYMNGGNTAIHSGNIGSQSVNYATNAGNAKSLNNITDGYYLGTLNASGVTHGASYRLQCQHNKFSDNRFGLKIESGHEVRCDYATASDVSNTVISLRTHNSYADIFSTSLAYGHACWNKWTFISGQSVDSTAAGYVKNAPYSSAALWHEVLTMGITNRAFQLAIGCFTHQRDMFIRYMHDAVWSGWFKINTTAI